MMKQQRRNKDSNRNRDKSGNKGKREENTGNQDTLKRSLMRFAMKKHTNIMASIGT
jgi:hypothetical protein